MSPLSRLPLQCSRLLSSEHWRTLLLRGDFVPYLWDIESNQFSDFSSAEWDYERLVRQLSQPGFWEWLSNATAPSDPDHTRGLLQLRNRRRIWRVLEDMEMETPHPVPKLVFEDAWEWVCSRGDCPHHTFVTTAASWDSDHSVAECTGQLVKRCTGVKKWIAIAEPGVTSAAIHCEPL